MSTGRPLSVMTVLIGAVVSGSNAQPLTEAPVGLAVRLDSAAIGVKFRLPVLHGSATLLP